jgi:hypothetical protein
MWDESATAAHELKCVLLIDYKLTLPTYVVSNTSSVAVCRRKVDFMTSAGMSLLSVVHVWSSTPCSLGVTAVQILNNHSFVSTTANWTTTICGVYRISTPYYDNNTWTSPMTDAKSQEQKEDAHTVVHFSTFLCSSGWSASLIIHTNTFRSTVIVVQITCTSRSAYLGRICEL